jgi:hypothetical protein
MCPVAGELDRELSPCVSGAIAGMRLAAIASQDSVKRKMPQPSFKDEGA